MAPTSVDQRPSNMNLARNQSIGVFWLFFSTMLHIIYFFSGFFDSGELVNSALELPHLGSHKVKVGNKNS